MTTIQVVKLDVSGTITRQYEGKVVERGPHAIVIEAPFVADKPEVVFLDLVLRTGDRFVETYFDDRGYNIYEIYDRDSLGLKGWYCNLSRPARITADAVTWVDLALDLLVWPDGRRALLDEDEFAALSISRAEREQVRRDLLQLEQHFERMRPPP